MGTSSNHRSRDIPSWTPARAVLGRLEVPVDVQSREIWRSALADQTALIQERLASDVVSFACSIAQSEKNPIAASSQLDERLHEAKSASLIDSIAKRALVRAVALGGGADRFGAELFAETVSYLASRDLPSYMGAEGRIKNAEGVIGLKNALQEQARSAAASVTLFGAQSWGTYVNEVLRSLSAVKK